MASAQGSLLNPDTKIRSRNVRLLYKQLLDEVIIKKEDFPDAHFDLLKRIAEEQGREMSEFTEEVKEAIILTAQEEQKSSLQQWCKYLASNEAVYPAWFKFLTFKNIIKLSQLDKQTGKFKERSPTTVAPFPEIDYEALALLYDRYKDVIDDPKLQNDKAYMDFISKKFSKQYAEIVLALDANLASGLEKIEGEWKVYRKGQPGAAKNLYDDIKNKRTGWCTAGLSTAELSLKHGDFYVYFTNNEEGLPIYPRLAIRMENEKIAEVRGTLPDQAIAPSLQGEIDTKLADFGEQAREYQKKSLDMRMLTEIDKKTVTNENLTAEDLRFLYEIDSKIEGFGHGSDRRIKRILNSRNLKEDMAIISPGKNIVYSLGKYSDEAIQEDTDIFIYHYSQILSPEITTKEKSPLFFADTLAIRKLKNKENYTQEELRYLYQLDRTIATGSPLRNLREVIAGRDHYADVTKIFECQTVVFSDTFLVSDSTDVFYFKKGGSSDWDFQFLDKKTYPGFFKTILMLNALVKKASDLHQDLTKEEIGLLYDWKIFKTETDKDLPDHNMAFTCREKFHAIQKMRNFTKDMAILYDCEPNEIVIHDESKISLDTKIYFKQAETDLYGGFAIRNIIDFRVEQENLQKICAVNATLENSGLPFHVNVHNEGGVMEREVSNESIQGGYYSTILDGKKELQYFQLDDKFKTSSGEKIFIKNNSENLKLVDEICEIVSIDLEKDSGAFDVEKVLSTMLLIGYKPPDLSLTAAINFSPPKIMINRLSLHKIPVESEDKSLESYIYLSGGGSFDIDTGHSYYLNFHDQPSERTSLLFVKIKEESTT